ncbi:hypothetical protein Tco_0563861 [Tanacetum coccineum]
MALVPVNEAGSMSHQVPVLTATNYPVWAVKVKSIMDAYGLWGTVEPRALGEEPDSKKSENQALALFVSKPYQEGHDRVRTARLATLKRELKSLRMKEGETVDEFATKLSGLAPKARGLGYELEEQCFELDSMLFDEAVGRLKAYEERIKGAGKMEDTQGGLLLASDGKSHGCKHCGGGSSNLDDFGRGREESGSPCRDEMVTSGRPDKATPSVGRLPLATSVSEEDPVKEKDGAKKPVINASSEPQGAFVVDGGIKQVDALKEVTEHEGDGGESSKSEPQGDAEEGGGDRSTGDKYTRSTNGHLVQVLGTLAGMGGAIPPAEGVQRRTIPWEGDEQEEEDKV